MCVYYTFLDNDDAERKVFLSAESDNLISIKSNIFITCDGSPNSEFEDSLQLDIYKQTVLDEFGVNLDSQKFRSNKKWSDRVRDVFLDQGKFCIQYVF